MAKQGQPRLIPSYIAKYLFHADTLSGQSLFLEYGEWSEDVLFDHVDDKVEVRDDDC